MPAPMLAAAPVEVAAAAAEVVELAELAVDRGVDIVAGLVVMLDTLETLEVELGVGVTELTRTRVLVMVVVAVEVVISSAAAKGAATRQREAMMAVNFILQVDRIGIKVEYPVREMREQDDDNGSKGLRWTSVMK